MYSMLCLLLCFNGGLNMPNKDLMINGQLKVRGIHDKLVLEAMYKVPREKFISKEQSNLAYIDAPLSIEYGQTISQPFIVALMTEAAQLNHDAKVLEIGTGCGYQTAILAEISKEVYTIEIIKELAEDASKRLRNLGYANIHTCQGDGYKGWKDAAPFDAIIVTAAPKEIPKNLIEQLKIGGKMVIPVGGWVQELKVITRTPDSILEEALIPVRFVPMVHSK